MNSYIKFYRLRIMPVAAIALVSLSSLTVPDTGTLTLTVTGLRNSKGSVLVSLYNTDKNFPGEAAKDAFVNGKAEIVNSIAIIGFKDIPYGKYAIAMLHDENNNQKMDFNIVGLPKEGYGFSNNAKGTFGPPSFAKAAFELITLNKNISIKVNY